MRPELRPAHAASTPTLLPVAGAAGVAADVDADSESDGDSDKMLFLVRKSTASASLTGADPNSFSDSVSVSDWIDATE